MAHEVDQGRSAFANGAWADAYELLSGAGVDALDSEDLHRLGMAAYLTGRDDEADRILALSHRSWVDAGENRRAAREAFWVALMHVDRHEMAQAGGWFARGSRLIEGEEECAETGLFVVPEALMAMFGGDAVSGLELFREAGAIGDRVQDRNLCSLARLGEGQCLTSMGRTGEGLALLDEVMVSVVAGETAPMVSGLIFCAVIETCNQVMDLRRATEWTEALSDWCATRPDMQSHRGRCLVHRAEVLRYRGEWSSALVELDSARRALGEVRRPALGAALYEMGELHRLRGDVDAAEQAYREASRLGHSTGPGLSLLRLQQGRADDAWRALHSHEADGHPGRSAVLWAATAEIGLTCGRHDEVDVACLRLREIAADVGSDYLMALASFWEGRALLGGTEPDAAEACGPLRRAAQIWQSMDAPVEAARARAALGAARLALGDTDTATLEFEAARGTFSAVGARPDLRALDEMAGRSNTAPLTDREIEVLACAARGLTNRDIATELHLSQHTVRRHLQNTFTKLGVSTRAAATSWAHRHGLIR